MIDEPILEFGKYSGMALSEVMENDPDYIGWCIDNGIEWIIDNLDDDDLDLFLDEYQNRQNIYKPL